MSNYSEKLRKERREELTLRATSFSDETDFAGLPPFLKAGIIKGLEKKLAAEKDSKKKAEIQVKIDKLKE